MSLNNVSNYLITRSCNFVIVIVSKNLNKLNTIYKKVVFENLYIKRDSSLFIIFVVEYIKYCLLNLLSNISNIVRLIYCQIYRTLFAQFVVKHIKHYLFVKLSSL